MSIQSATAKTNATSSTRKSALSGRSKMERFLRLANENQEEDFNSHEPDPVPRPEVSSAHSPRTRRVGVKSNSSSLTMPAPSETTDLDQSLLKPFERETGRIGIEDLEQAQVPRKAPPVRELQLPNFESPKPVGQGQPGAVSGEPMVADRPSARQTLPPANGSGVSAAHTKKVPAQDFSLSPAGLQQNWMTGRRRLEEQVTYVNQLSTHLELALVDLRTLSVGIDRLRTALESSGRKSLSPSRVLLEDTSIQLPCIQRYQDGRLKLATRPVDLQRAERDASATAQFLRSRLEREPQRRARAAHSPVPAVSLQSHPVARGGLPNSQTLLKAQQLVKPSPPVVVPQDRAKPRRPLKQKASRSLFRRLWNRLCPPQTLGAAILDAVIWIILTATLRMVWQIVASLAPAVLPVLTSVLVGLVLIVACQLLFMPHAGKVLIYRGLLVLAGLLLGGRL